jgi:GAF domain-containing protein
MADQSALKRAFADYARTIAGRYDIGDVLYRLTDQVTEVLGVDGAGVSLRDADATLQFVTASDETITRAERAQVEAQEGACHDAFASGQVVTVADLTAEQRWPTFRRRALDVGLRAVAGIPLRVEDQRIGALDVYSRTPREWPADDVADAQLLADMASGYIVNATRLTERERRAAQLQHALDSRVVIEQAKGIVAERHQIDPATAFHRLRVHARGHQARIHDVARAVVEGRLRL